MNNEPKITKEMLIAMQGVVPATLTTCSKDGMPNVTYISQVYFVSDNQVALSCLFMNKTYRNLQENPYARVVITCPETISIWQLSLKFIAEQTAGPLFDEMDMQLTAIASLHGMGDFFKIKAALICQVEQIDVLYDNISASNSE